MQYREQSQQSTSCRPNGSGGQPVPCPVPGRAYKLHNCNSCNCIADCEMRSYDKDTHAFVFGSMLTELWILLSSHASRSYDRVLVLYTQPSSRKSRRRLTGAGQQPRRAGKWTVFGKREPAKVKFDR
ncbi:hypothetical protein RR46_03132 [Papilio xuthus]|uniref:Uncharacterized protein n=1 Tax=Papilio xuthus TaxID=66420 RepID=A0A194Q8Q6_PAPXU|nr:hypothetical protein RR46_03132 [Papilio xuthus]